MDSASDAGDAGASDSLDSSVRDCGSHLTKAKPAKLVLLIPTLGTVSLGEGLDISKTPPTLGVTYATGNVSAGNQATVRGSAGDDQPAASMFPIPPGTFDLFQDDVGGATPIQILAASIASSGDANATGTTYSVGEWKAGTGWGMSAISMTANAPHPAGPHDAFISTLTSSTFFGYAFAIQFDSTCKMAALADALGVKAKAANVLAQATSAAVSQALVENGAQITVVVVANKHHPAVDALFAASDAGSSGTVCAADNLPACSALMNALSAEAKSWASTPASTDLGAITAGTDPAWSIVAYDFVPVP
jgi:hypothetical protein